MFKKTKTKQKNQGKIILNINIYLHIFLIKTFRYIKCLKETLNSLQPQTNNLFGSFKPLELISRNETLLLKLKWETMLNI